MSVDFIYPEFEVIRNDMRCIACRVCERQCANEVHYYSEERGMMMSDETKCVDCVFWDFPVGSVAKILLSQFRGTQVQSLVRELDLTGCN